MLNPATTATVDRIHADLHDLVNSTGISLTEIGLRFVGDPNFERNLRNGKDIRTRTMDRFYAARAGLEAARAGRPSSANPHPNEATEEGTNLGAAWSRGYSTYVEFADKRLSRGSAA